MISAELRKPPGAVPAKTLQEIKRGTAALGCKIRSKAMRTECEKLLAGIEVLQQQLEAFLSPFSPQEAGERMVTEFQGAEGGAWSGADLKEKFGLSSAVLSRRRKEHRIIYWRDAKHDNFYPCWQFTGSGALLPGIQEILQLFHSHDEWRVMRYFLGVRKQLGNQRPLDLLRSGAADEVIAHARDHAAENTW